MNAVGIALLGVAPSVVTLTVQVTCLLLLALALAWLGRHGSPRTLHLLWTTTFVLVLALPLLSPIGPSWEVPLLPVAADAARPAVSPASGTTPLADMVPVPPPDTTTMRGTLVLAELARLDARPGEADGAPVAVPTGHAVVQIAWIVWVLGCVLSLVPLAAAAFRLRRLVRTARPVRDPEWSRDAEELRHRLGVRSGIRLLASAAVATPMTAGLRQPVILLPESAWTWRRELRAAVLAHELIHVRRRDALRQLVRRGVCALYWFHPLVWAAERFADLASEKACDEEVLALLGARPSEYARHLQFLAARLSRDPRALALAIVYPSQLERRIMSILARRRPHPSFVRSASTLTVIGVASVAISAARPVPIDDGAAGAVATFPNVALAEVPTEVAARTATVAESRRRAATPSASQGVECLSSSHDSIRSFSIGGGGSVVPNWKWTDGGLTIVRLVAGMQLCMRAEGDISLNTEGTAVQALGADSWLVIESRGENTHRLAVTRGRGGIEREWSVDGIRQPLDAEARRWRELMFTVMRGYQEAWLPYRGAMVLYGRISGYRNELSELMSAMRAGQLPRARRKLEEELAGWEAGILRMAETIRYSGLDDELGAIAQWLTEQELTAARLKTELEASELDALLRGMGERIQGEIRRLSLELRLEEADRSLQEVIAELEEATQ